MKVVRYNKELKDDWDRFIDTSKNGLFLFKTDYLHYHEDRFSDHSLMFYNTKGNVEAVFPACIIDDKVYSHAGLTFGSLLLSFYVKATDVLNIFDLIAAYYKKHNYNQIIYKAIPSVFHKYPAQEDLYAIFKQKAVIIRRDISSVIAIDDRIKFSETKRQLVKKCEKHNVQVGETTDYTEYWSLLTDTLAKFNTKPVHSISEISYLHSKFPNNIRLFQAKKEEELLAGIVIFDFGTVVHTQYMASSQTGRSFGALDYINHQLISQVFKSHRFYSFGISTENQGQYLNEGLIQQKENMGARGIVLDFYSITL